MVKTTTTGIHTIARRRISNGSSDDSAYSTSKGSPAIASPNAYSPIRSTTTISNGNRKRVSQQPAAVTISNAKRSKLSKKVNQHGRNSITNMNQTPITKRQSASSSSSAVTTAPSTPIGAGGIDDTIDKRNQHNDMERQRRIGLKNLFENLKLKIPTLCEKERAPKVNILREATLLCSRLTQEDSEYEKQKQRRTRLQQRLKFLREQMAARGMY